MHLRSGAATAHDASRAAASRLREAGVPEPAASAEVLLSELLGTRRGDLRFRREPLSREQSKAYEAMISRRLDREPVQRILGYAYFRNLRLSLGEEVLIPRADTESVVEAALERIDLRDGACRVLDLGTGSGAIALAIADERPVCEVHASDVSEAALRIARHNAELNLDCSERVTFHRADLVSGLEALAGDVDLLVSNPPYVASAALAGVAPEVRDWDPPLALDGGPDGLDLYRRLLAETACLLKPGAEVVLEVGDGQAEEVLCIGESAGLRRVGARTDLTGTLRAVILEKKGS